MATLTLEDLQLYHSIDRQIFSRLVLVLRREAAQSLLIMAFWLCLEDMRFPSIVLSMLSQPDHVLNGLAEEAASCLACLESKTPPNLMFRNGNLPLTVATLGTRLSLKMIHQKKFTLISNMKCFLKNVCAHVFTDILLGVIPFRAIANYPLIIPGFPHPTFGPLTIIPRSPDYVFPSEGMWGWSFNIEAPEDDRTMFLTFSRGYPVTVAEVKELFNSYYGDCVEDVSMEPPASASTSTSTEPQCLYARMVVRDISTIDRILSRGPIAKFRINGKHVWARKFERRESAQASTPG